MKQYAIGYADGSIREGLFHEEDKALITLEGLRRDLKTYGIPEEYHPVLMERTVETVHGSWRYRGE